MLIFQIDRLSLTKMNLSNDNIDRLFRAMYVTVAGFF